ncbi:cell division protein ZapA [Candidatus Puniceispirillum sp.]|nr:cell division protein ZapA [Candidatus Puniceispirillum sp.]
MSQSVVTICLNGHPYKIGCGAGEEDHVAKLGSEVEAVMQSLIASVGQIGEARLLAMVALILADRVAVPSNGKPHNGAGPVSSDMAENDETAAEALEDAAVRIAALASKLASGATNP